MLKKARIALIDSEKSAIEIVDEGLNDIYTLGLQIITYTNTEKVCAKEIIMLPGQTCPEHMHPGFGGYPGKEETFRVRWGVMYLYVPGIPTRELKAKIPEKYKFSVFNEIILNPGEQYLIQPETFHWFQAGPKGCIVSEFSTKSTDEADVFTDKRMVRVPKL